VNDALNSRFHFDTNALCEYFNNYTHDIDLIWTMLPEQAGALRAFANKRREEIPIFSYINWWDYRHDSNGYEPSYLWRLVDGFENSEVVGIQSEWMLECLKNEPKLAKNADLAKARVIPPKTPKIDYKGKTGYFIAFPHRISQESGFSEFMDLVRDKLKFKVWVSNLNNATIEKEPMVDAGMIENHEDYYKHLANCRFGVSYHVGYSMWSMSVLDMMAVGKVVLVPHKNAFPEMFGNGYPFYFSSKEEFLQKFDYLQNCQPEDLEMWGERNRMLAQKYFSWEKQAEDLGELFLGLVAKSGKTDKTSSVLEKIIDFGKIYKTDLINKNITSFGRQCSRAWNKCRIEMMRDHGIMDDHESEMTLFFTPENKSKPIARRPEKVPTKFDLHSKKEPALIPELF
jgi:glycosyltransferase involved in cell wall biosynthesis